MRKQAFARLSLRRPIGKELHQLLTHRTFGSRTAPLFFPGLEGADRGGLTPDGPPVRPRPGKNHPAIGSATTWSKMRYVALRHDQGLYITQPCPARRVGVPLACPLTGHIARGMTKGLTEFCAVILSYLQIYEVK